jgi:diguanylate cyclase (GGDEF)-like protein
MCTSDVLKGGMIMDTNNTGKEYYMKDESTSLYSKNFFIRNMNEIASKMITGVNQNKINRSKADTWSIMFCDIDALKYVNDTVGHVEADIAIKNIADIIKECIRTNRKENDTILYPDDKNIPIRFGGDEFIIILPNCTKEKAQLIKDRINGHLIKRCKDVSNMTLSIGIADTSEIDLPNPLDQNNTEVVNMFLSNLIEMAEERMRAEKNIDFDNLPYQKQVEVIFKSLNRIPGFDLNNFNHVNLLNKISEGLKDNLELENKKK